jgi:formyl-CoA transferase/CoA:oxalate CoA-transferase
VDGESAYFLSINRNKRSLTLDLADPAARPVVRQLVAWADVLVENFRAGALEKWGYDAATIAEWNPGLIHCSISAFGSDGPYRDRPGMDLLLQASGGLMSITGEPDRPPVRVGIPVVDLIASAYAVQGILAALHERHQSGLGQRVEVALQDGLMAWLTYHVTSYLMADIEPVRHGASHPSVAPYGAYATADGLLVMAIGTDGLWRNLCAALDRSELADDPRFATNRARIANRDELVPALEAVLADRSAEEWSELLVAAGVPCSPVRTIPEVLADPGIRARDPITESHRADGMSIPAPAIPVRFSRTPGSVRYAPPRLGEQSEAILDELSSAPTRR